MYFNHAFEKAILPSVTGGVVDLATTGTSADLSAGEIGIYDYDTNVVITSGGTFHKFYIACGSYYSADKISVFNGGYQESVKSKMINPKLITKFWLIEGNQVQNQIIAIGWDLAGTGGNNSGFLFECGKNYTLTLNVQGEPVLRTLTRNWYKDITAYTGCCDDDCTTSCTGDPVDAACVLLDMADQINQDPIMSEFIGATVFTKGVGNAPTQVYSAWDVEQNSALTEYTCVTGAGADDVVASLVLTVAYADTVFGDCTFSPTDKFNLDPIKIFASMKDDSGDPCAIRNTANSSTGEYVTTTQEPMPGAGLGESVVRDLIQSEMYRQNFFPDNMSVDSLRMRETELNPLPGIVSRSSLYDTYIILHNVPRFNNPTQQFDNEQYAFRIHVPQGTDMSAFTTIIDALLVVAGNGVVMETF